MLLLSVCGTERQLLCCSSPRCGCRSRERRDVIASAGPGPALISQELNLNLKWMLEIVQRAASRRVMVKVGKRTFAKFEVLESWRRDGLHGFMDYDFCIGDPISCLLTFSVILREGFFPALVMVVKSNYIYILFVSIRF